MKPLSMRVLSDSWVSTIVMLGNQDKGENIATGMVVNAANWQGGQRAARFLSGSYRDMSQ